MLVWIVVAAVTNKGVALNVACNSPGKSGHIPTARALVLSISFTTFVLLFAILTWLF